MNDGKQAALSAIQKINAVEGFDPDAACSGVCRPQHPGEAFPASGDGAAGVVPAQISGGARVCCSYRRQGLLCGYGQGLSQLHKPARTVSVGGDRIPRDTKPTNRRYLRVNGRRPPPLGSLFAMPALDFSSARPVIPSTLRLWMSWAASSGVGEDEPQAPLSADMPPATAPVAAAVPRRAGGSAGEKP